MQQLAFINTSTTIKKITSVFLLFALLLSISPKQYLHAVFAGHTDVNVNLTKNEVQVNADGYSCDCNQVVVTSPFLSINDPATIKVSNSFTSFNNLSTAVCLSPAHIQFQLRGPPSLI